MLFAIILFTALGLVAACSPFFVERLFRKKLESHGFTVMSPSRKD